MGKKQTTEDKYLSYYKKGILDANDTAVYDNPSIHCQSMKLNNLSELNARNFFTAFNKIRIDLVAHAKGNEPVFPIQYDSIVKAVYGDNKKTSVQKTTTSELGTVDTIPDVDDDHGPDADADADCDYQDDGLDVPCVKQSSESDDLVSITSAKHLANNINNPFKVVLDDRNDTIKTLNRDLNAKNDIIAALVANNEKLTRAVDALSSQLQELKLFFQKGSSGACDMQPHSFNKLVVQALIKLLAKDNDPAAQFLTNAFMNLALT